MKIAAHKDTRGSFREGYKDKDLQKLIGRRIDFCQDNLTDSKKGCYEACITNFLPLASLS